MFYQIVTQLLDIISPAAAVLLLPALFVFSYLSDNQEYGKSNEEKIYELAKFNNCSEFHLFCLAGANWNITQQRIDHDFRTYINNGLMPFYVRDFIRSPSDKNIKTPEGKPE